MPEDRSLTRRRVQPDPDNPAELVSSARLAGTDEVTGDPLDQPWMNPNPNQVVAYQSKLRRLKWELQGAREVGDHDEIARLEDEVAKLRHVDELEYATPGEQTERAAQMQGSSRPAEDAARESAEGDSDQDRDNSPTPGADEGGEPPRAGRGSSRDAWSTYAQSRGVTVTDDMDRDAIVAAVDQGDKSA